MLSNTSKSKISTKRIVLIAIFIAGGLMANIIDNLLPPLFITGARLGISNIFVLLGLVLFGGVDAFIILISKCLLASLFTGFSTIIYSLTAGVISLALQVVIYHFFKNRISIISLSIFGGVMHNLIQNLVYFFVTQSAFVLAYSPYLAMLGCASGCLIGICVYLVLSKVPQEQYAKLLNN